jgi:hypothetical protein
MRVLSPSGRVHRQDDRPSAYWMFVSTLCLGCVWIATAGCRGQAVETRRPNPERVNALIQDIDSGTWD